MLNFVNKIYVISATMLYLALSPKVDDGVLIIYFYGIVMTISYFLMLHVNSSLKNSSYTNVTLAVEVFLFSIVTVAIENFISFYYTHNFFMFSTSDAVFYHTQTLMLMKYPIWDAIHKYLQYMSFDDLGMILVLYPLYHIYPSNLTLNFFYVIIGVISALSLFRLSLNFMSRKYAFMVALAYPLASFVLFLESTGLKESFMDMLVILAFDYYYKFINHKNGINLIKTLIFLAIIMLFRPAISIMIIGAIGISMQVSRQGGIVAKMLSVGMFFGFIAMSNMIMDVVNTYTTGGVGTLVEARESQGMIIGSVSFTYAVNALSQAIGPIPTFIAIPKKLLTMFYAPGLMYRVLISFAFWVGSYYIYKTRSHLLYPLVLFSIIEMSSLAFLMDGLELRKAMPHIAIVFVVAFWFFDKYDAKEIYIKNAEVFKGFFKLSLLFLIIIIFYWNFR